MDIAPLDHELYQEIVGRKLSAVTFVTNYVQLQFDPPPRINAYSPITVISGGGRVASSDDQFRNRLCEQITTVVRSVDVSPDEAFVIRFGDDSAISISLRLEHHIYGEAVYIEGSDRWGII